MNPYLVAAAVGAGAIGSWFGNKDKPPPLPGEIFENADGAQDIARQISRYFGEAHPELSEFAREAGALTERTAADYSRARMSADELADEFAMVGDEFSAVARDGARDLRRAGSLGQQSAAADRARRAVLAGADDSRAAHRMALARRGITAGAGAGVGESSAAGGLAALAAADAAERERMRGEELRIANIAPSLDIMALESGQRLRTAGVGEEESNAWARGANRVGGIHSAIQGLGAGAQNSLGTANDFHFDVWDAQNAEYNAKKARRRSMVGDFVNIGTSVLGAGMDLGMNKPTSRGVSAPVYRGGLTRGQHAGKSHYDLGPGRLY